MTPDFAHVYLWARQLQQAEPANREARWLVVLLRQWDDLEHRRRAFPSATPQNLQPAVEETILGLVRRLRTAERGAA